MIKVVGLTYIDIFPSINSVGAILSDDHGLRWPTHTAIHPLVPLGPDPIALILALPPSGGCERISY